jgi:hypothetical protein
VIDIEKLKPKIIDNFSIKIKYLNVLCEKSWAIEC